ncbi:unnamed protein product [Mytilus edulis]|uniref:Uncharacterized protein n=1 Tax=Mytilus edulis TaxID=6550 RepID=A0A8S3SPR1_MYTED|nr:unnamed protein product [Mytilus edulis]
MTSSGTRKDCVQIVKKDYVKIAKKFTEKAKYQETIKKNHQVLEFRQIKISEYAAKLDFKDQKKRSSTNPDHCPDIKNHNRRETSAYQRKNKIDITGCVILPNGHLLIANWTKENQLIEYSDTGEHIRDISVSGRPFGITDTDMEFLEITNSNTFNVEKKIRLPNGCFGISIKEGRLCINRGDSTIQVLDLSGTQLETLKVESNDVFYITTSRDRMFYTYVDKNIVHCCSLKGEAIWDFKSKAIAHPYDVAVGNYNNVYVICKLILCFITDVIVTGRLSGVYYVERKQAVTNEE